MDLDDIKRGEEARIVLEHPLFKEAFAKIKDGIVDSLASSAMGDEKTHNRLAIALQLLNQIERQFKEQIETGTMAAIQANEKMGQKLKRVVNW